MKERIWTRNDGRKIPIAKMDTGHLANAIMMLERNAARAKQAPDKLFAPQYGWLEEELATRVPEDPNGDCRLSRLSGYLEHLVKAYGAELVAVALDKAIGKVEGA